MIVLSRPASRAAQPDSKPRLASGWWLLPSILGGLAVWVWIGISIARWLF